MAGTSVHRGTQEAQCWQPAPFPRLCGGILPASPSLRVSLWPLAVPVSANSRRTKRESPHKDQVSAAALGPAGLTRLVTGSQSPPLRMSGAQGLSPGCPCLLPQETLVSALPAFLALTLQMGKLRPQEGKDFPWGQTRSDRRGVQAHICWLPPQGSVHSFMFFVHILCPGSKKNLSQFCPFLGADRVTPGGPAPESFPLGGCRSPYHFSQSNQRSFLKNKNKN